MWIQNEFGPYVKTKASSIHTIEKEYDIVIKGNENKNIQFIIIWLTLLSNIQFKCIKF